MRSSVFIYGLILCLHFCVAACDNVTATTDRRVADDVIPVEDDTSEEGAGSDYLEGDMDEVAAGISNGTAELKFATLCETPNHEPGYCVGIKSCPKLLTQVGNLKARTFLRASMCGPNNEDPTNPKVCCGKYANYRNVSKTIEYMSILPKNCGSQRVVVQGRVIGGQMAALGQYPWMARLYHKNKFNFKSFGCSGFLIHPKYVLTAAHCVHDQFSDVRGKVYSVYLGEHNIDTEADCFNDICADPVQVSRVTKVMVHPNYNPTVKSQYNDIALLYLNKGMKSTDFIRPICLLEDTKEVPQRYFISGWGKTETDVTSPIKMHVDLPPFEKAACMDSYKALGIEITDSQICAGGIAGKDSCSGDSGGPLMFSQNGTFFAAGIVSFGVGCGHENWPGIYTNIPSFVPWIKNMIVETNLLRPKSPGGASRHRKPKTKQPSTV